MGYIFSYSLIASLLLLVAYPFLNYAVKHGSYFRFKRHLLLVGVILILSLPLLSRGLGSTATSTDFAKGPSDLSLVFNVIEAVPDNVYSDTLPFLRVVLLVYICGLFLTVLREIASFIPLYRLASGGKKIRKDGYLIYILSDSEIEPFSWGNSIFLNEEYLNESNDSILRHEKAHIDHRHWLDLILADLLCILLWYNPLAWKSRSLIKLNHEFEADDDVINSGVDIYEYQKLLISHVMKRIEFGMTETFASSRYSLRRRVLLIGKKESSRKSLTVALCAIPALLIGLLFFSFPAPARFLREMEAAHVVRGNGIAFQSFSYAPNERTGKFSELEDRNMPEYEGGDDMLYSFLLDNMIYPEEPEEEIGKKHKVVVHFNVDVEGNISKVWFKHPKGSVYEKEAARVISLTSGKWRPAIKDGKPVECSAALPITFVQESRTD